MMGRLIEHGDISCMHDGPTRRHRLPGRLQLRQCPVGMDCARRELLGSSEMGMRRDAARCSELLRDGHVGIAAIIHLTMPEADDPPPRDGMVP